MPPDLIAYELGYRYQPRPDLLFDLATFYNRYDDLRSQEPSPEGPSPWPAGSSSRSGCSASWRSR